MLSGLEKGVDRGKPQRRKGGRELAGLAYSKPVITITSEIKAVVAIILVIVIRENGNCNENVTAILTAVIHVCMYIYICIYMYVYIYICNFFLDGATAWRASFLE